MSWSAAFLVFLGGGLGSLCRFGISKLPFFQPGDFPWSVLAANALASYVLGLSMVQLISGAPPMLRWLVVIGFCGGFSTFSTFSMDNLILLQKGQPMAAVANVLLNVFVCLMAVWLGARQVLTS